MEQIKVGDKVSLRKGSASYRHFINYMPIDGEVIDINIHHMIGHFNRPYRVRFTDERTSWYSNEELTFKSRPGEGPLTSGDYPA